MASWVGQQQERNYLAIIANLCANRPKCAGGRVVELCLCTVAFSLRSDCSHSLTRWASLSEGWE